jgi:DNA helicase-4
MPELIIVIIIIILFGIYLSVKLKRAAFEKSPEVQAELKCVEGFIKAVETAKQDYFRYSVKESLKEDYKKLYKKFSNPLYNSLSKYPNVQQFKRIYPQLDKLVKEWNTEFVKSELTVHANFLSNIDGKSLDDQQRRAVIVDEDNNLVLAGAGSGKTLTISGKVKYLVDKKNVNPDDILLISFTRKAADEMQERITNRLKINVEAKTFHKLGLDIISRYKGVRPDVFEELPKVIDEYFNEEIKRDKEVIRSLIEFFGYYLNIPKDLEEYDTLGDAYEHVKNSDFETLKSKIEFAKNTKTTIKGETVRSLEEVTIANFLYLNGVNYTYEKEYPYEYTSDDDKYRKKYKPDFYLDDYDIYLEHFGITKDFRAPWLTPVEEQKYIEGIFWKRDLHKKMNTTLIETYSYYNKDGMLLSNLDRLLKYKGVKYCDIDHKEIYEMLFSQRKDNYFEEFKKLIQTFIGLFKSRGYSEENFEELIAIANGYKNTFLRQRTILFLSIVKPIFSKYQSVLENSRYIDFNDMINIATDIIRNGLITLSYKYIIVDEYQDISMSRFNLVKEIKKQTNARLMVVGDDWQSIYRFTGSDIDLFTSFKKYFGFCEIMKIEKTYRNSQELIHIAGDFIMKNPKQLKKDLVSDKHNSNPIRLFGFNADIKTAVKKAIDEIIYLFGKESEIMILGRTNYDIEVLNGSEEFSIIKNRDGVFLKDNRYPDLQMSFLTAHKSKGLEANNVIIINLHNRLLGFPNKISDDPVLSLVLTDSDSFEYAEERRLFYVALTRTKNSTYLMVPDQHPSVFVDELIQTHNLVFNMATDEKSIMDNPNCPVCQKGYRE